ncbi:hypothetical protein DV738_g968, partial [Chaetothyriales sp. CBS 135597]
MLRQQQQVMAQRSHQDSRPADRGRDATEQATTVRSDRHRRTEAEADRAIERMRALLERINHLEEEFTKITKIKEVVKKLKQRVDETHERVERTSASRHGDSRGGDRSSGVRHADLAYRPRDRHR